MRVSRDLDTISALEVGRHIAITSLSYDAAHIALRGRIVAGPRAKSIRKALLSWFKFCRVQKWILDMTEVVQIDASGIGILAKSV